MHRIKHSLLALALLGAVLIASSFAQAQSVAQTENVQPGGSVSFAASADGNPAPSFEWFKDGIKIADGQTFAIQNVAPSHAGSYTVKASNVAGSAVSDPFVLTVYLPPSKSTIKVTARNPNAVTVSVPPGTNVTRQK